MANAHVIDGGSGPVPESPSPGTARLSALEMRQVLAEHGECQYDPELHSGPERGQVEPAEDRAAREQVAREVCASCPMRVLCLRYALTVRPEDGIYATFTASEIAELGEALRADLAEVA